MTSTADLEKEKSAEEEGASASLGAHEDLAKPCLRSTMPHERLANLSLLWNERDATETFNFNNVISECAEITAKK